MLKVIVSDGVEVDDGLHGGCVDVLFVIYDRGVGERDMRRRGAGTTGRVGVGSVNVVLESVHCNFLYRCIYYIRDSLG